MEYATPPKKGQHSCIRQKKKKKRKKEEIRCWYYKTLITHFAIGKNNSGELIQSPSTHPRLSVIVFILEWHYVVKKKKKIVFYLKSVKLASIWIKLVDNIIFNFFFLFFFFFFVFPQLQPKSSQMLTLFSKDFIFILPQSQVREFFSFQNVQHCNIWRVRIRLMMFWCYQNTFK